MGWHLHSCRASLHRCRPTDGWCTLLGRLVVLLLGLAALCVVMLLCAISGSTHTYTEFLIRSLKGPIPPDDPELVNYIRNEILVSPSKLPYNLLGASNTALVAKELSENFYTNITNVIFKGMREGVFIEAGALDGETMSNTLHLEMTYGWSGLLVEADPVSYQMMSQKNRKAWTVNSCLSPNPYPSKELMSSKSHYTGPSIMSAGTKGRAMHSLVSYRKGHGLVTSWYKLVQCLPLESILLALDIKHIDLFVLDVEGAEMDILKYFNFDNFEIDVLYLEWKVREDHQEVAANVEHRGYRLYSVFKEDLVFVRKGSKYDTGVSFVIPPMNKTLTEDQKKAFADLKSKGIFVKV